MNVPWFKFYADDFLNDMKMLYLNPVQKYLFVVLLCLGHREGKGGFIPFVENNDDLMAIARLDSEKDRENGDGIIQKLEKLKIIEKKDGGIFLINYVKRQGEYLTGYERVRRYREKSNVINDNVHDVINDNTKKLSMITTDKSRVDKSRVDKSRVDKIRIDKNIAREKSRAARTKQKEDTPMTLNEFLEWCKKSEQRHIRLIADYAEEKKPEYTSRAQWDEFIKRNVRPAKSLSPYTDDQIGVAFQKMRGHYHRMLEREGKRGKWTLETIAKYLDDIQEA